jgi:Baseplate J-like protein
MNIRRELPKNPLIRDGVSQRQRQVLALSPDYVKIDEGDLADFLVFAHKLSEQVAYYNADNKKDGNWQEFFASSTPVQIALISKIRPQRIKDDYTLKLDNFLENLSRETLAPILNLWKQELLKPIPDWYEVLESYTPLKSIIKGLVKTNLTEPLRRMQSFERIYGDVATEPYDKFVAVFGLDLRSTPTDDCTVMNSKSEAHAELDPVFQALFQTYHQIIKESQKHLKDSLTARQDHPPHLSLYFAFWEVMQPARDDLNRMTQRHLDFFYRHVLRLSDRPAEPDHAHLIFELAKSQKEYKLDAETRFKAGKDASGIELFYKLDAETVLHRATIASLKGLFLDSKEIATGEIPDNLLGLYTSPQANSFDGKGRDFPNELAVKAWLPFGNDTRNHALLGLAIASDIFYLQEGDRTVIFTLTFDKAPAAVKASDLPNIFIIDFSGKKDWIVAKIRQPETSETSLEGQTLKLEVSLTADQEPIGIYHPELPGAALLTNMPVARLHLKDEARVNNFSPYSYLCNLKLTKLTISTKEIEVRDLVLQNDLSTIDPTKPFQPFGSRPVVGATFYVGSKEIFQKNISLLKIKIAWQGLPADLATYYRGYYVEGDQNPPNFNNFSARVERLTQHTWSAEGLPNDYNLFNPDSDRLIDRTPSQTPLPGEEIDNLTSFNVQTHSGFLRFILKQNFLHDEFAHKYAIQTLASAKNFAAGEYVNGAVYEVVTGEGENKTRTLKRWRIGDTLSDNLKNVAPITINEPYTPVIQKISLKYTAVAERKDCTLFHLHPFDGFADWDEKQPYFLPQFNNEGELLIALQNLDPPTALPLLFQVAEETADTDLAKAEVHWHYLKDNTWESLSDRIVSDSTNGLITSGIVNLGIPEDISKDKTTILDPSLYWIKASVKARSGAICQIIGVHTQAAQVSFTDIGNDPNHLAVPLAPDTIAKLAVPTPEVKKVEQLYNSFGGKVKEQPDHFYTRISEHLRHKGRAVTIFDYERLVLEKFPEIYKVRCINHGQVDQDKQFQELVPGAITLVVIPDLSQRSTTNNLEPKVNINLLEKIEKYLVSLSSPWADIKVVNPAYEHIQVECEVKFKSPYDGNFGYYRRDLEQAIAGFLTPWTVDKGAEIHFGGTVYRSSILNFIEQQYYVDYVVNFQMHHHNQRDVREAIASTARSVLTSVSVESTGQTHMIKEANTVFVNQKLASGILGYEALADIILQPEFSIENRQS